MVNIYVGTKVILEAEGFMMIDFDIHDTIETPENVELKRTLAGLGARFYSALYDYLLISLVLILVYFVLFLIFGNSSDFGYTENIFIAFVIVFSTIFTWGYFAFFEWITNGQTPGKKSVYIRVVCENGSPITFRHIAIRNILRFVDIMPGFYLIGCIAVFASKRQQRLGDMAAGTIVISEEKLQYGASDKANKKRKNWDTEITAECLEKSGLNPEELSIIMNFKTRSTELSPDAMEKVLPAILKPILSRQGLWRDDMTFLEMMDYVNNATSTGDQS